MATTSFDLRLNKEGLNFFPTFCKLITVFGEDKDSDTVVVGWLLVLDGLETPYNQRSR